MSEKKIEELQKDLMRWPRAVSKQLSNHNDLLKMLNEQQVGIIRLICQLHNIDTKEFEKKIRGSTGSANE